MELSPCLAETEWSEFLPAFDQNEAQRSGFALERKKEGADMQFSRLLRKPRKRNGASFFPPKTKSKPSEAGSLWRGRRKERKWSFRHAWRKRNAASFF